MGTDCHVVLVGGHTSDLDFAEEQIRRLEALWTRFSDASEISRLNAANGEWMSVSFESIVLIARAVRAARLTSGWFDPFLGRDIVWQGYDRDFGLMEVSRTRTTRLATARVRPDGTVIRERPRFEDVKVDVGTRSVRLPAGYDFDSGGIGKGLGADLVSRMLIDAGVAGALVNLGGDLRCRGAQPDRGWLLAIDDALKVGQTLDEHVRLGDGALATSTPLRRAWHNDAGRLAHHILSPLTGEPAAVEVAAVTVIAPTGWLAEAFAKCVMLAGPEVGAPLLIRHRSAAIVQLLDGSIARLP